MLMTGASMAVIYKVAGYGFLTVAATGILNYLGKPNLAKLLHTAAWATLAIYCIGFTMNYAHKILWLWHG